MAVTIWRYNNRGHALGVLTYDSAEHEEDLQNSDTLTVITPGYVNKNDYLVWRDSSGTWHEHVVDSTTREHNGKRARTVAKCSNSINELYGSLAGGEFYQKKSVHWVLSTLLADSRWTVGACSNFGTIEIEVWHKNLRECIADICELVGGELVTEIEVGSNGVTSRTVRIVQERGSRAVMRQFRYGRNMTGVKREVSQEQVYTAVVAYGAKANLATLQAKYDRETDADKKAEYQRKIKKLQDNDYAPRITVKLPSNRANAAEILANYGVPNGSGGVGHHWLVYTDLGCTDGDFLRIQARRALRVCDVPLVRYEFDVSQADDDMWRDVVLGNRVLCVDEGFNPAFELEERISYIRRMLSGRMQCRIAIGERADSASEQYRATSNAIKSTTGNNQRIASRVRNPTGGNYPGVDIPSSDGWDDEGYDPESGGGGEERAMPSAISISVKPSKLAYIEGQKIDYSGIEVVLLDENGEIFTDDNYPDGVIPFDQLTFSAEYAVCGDAWYITPTSDISDYIEGALAVAPTATEHHEHKLSDRGAYTGDYNHDAQYSLSNGFCTVIAHEMPTEYKPTVGYSYICAAENSDGWLYTLGVSVKKDGTMPQRDHGNYDCVFSECDARGTYTKDGKTVHYYATNILIADSGVKQSYTVGTFTANSFTLSPSGMDYLSRYKEIAWEMVYNESRVNACTLPVSWESYDGQSLSDSFEIRVDREDSYDGSGGGEF